MGADLNVSLTRHNLDRERPSFQKHVDAMRNVPGNISNELQFKAANDPLGIELRWALIKEAVR